ncbi:MAG TPA: YraN family protein [Chryseosolibacter sp.]|nr:YraN family protein [Chryseosolibacter sp.]
MSDETEIGRRGENLAAKFLEEKGFTVAARNFRYGKAEIDLIVQRGEWLLFVEVKTRSSLAYGQPEEFLTPPQVNRIFDAAEEYIFRVDWQGHVRFDVVSIKLGREVEIEHFEDAIN